MSPLSDRPASHRSIGALIALVFVTLWAVVAGAAIQPRVDNPHGKFKENCQLCHTARAWKAVKVSPKFDHGKFGFPLTGAHATANCMGCHTALDFAQSKTQCASCHQDPHRGEMGTDCAHCHAARSFQDRGPMVRAHQLSRFPLTGSHITVDCESCHKPAAQGQLQFVGTNVECYSCHKAQYDATTAPNHKGGGFSTQCQTCHTPVGWTGANFDHAAAGFPLTGSHSTSVRVCDDCHHGIYTATSVDCYSCHQNSTPGYLTAAPPHDPTNFPTATANCIGCHQAANANHVTWAGAMAFDHSTVGFATVGGHSLTVRACTDCHNTIGYTAKATDKDCITCHATTNPGYNNTGAGNPVHNATSFPSTTARCTSCHSAAATSFTSWAGGVYVHATMQLTNAHAGRACADCHTNGNYTTVTFSCIGCHQTSTPGYASATNPPHSPTNFPTTNAACMGCHNTTAFQPSTWPANHSTTAFAANFTGFHTTMACTDCHNSATWSVLGTGSNCYGCHATDYANTTTPKHDTTAFPVAGCSCHSTTAWSPATQFDHTAGGFPLNGTHSLSVRVCTDCHNASTGNYVNTSKACETCHLNSTPGYANAGPGNPTHNTTYFPYAQCTTCHASAAASLVSWQGGTFTHSVMQLTNAHAGRACADCHTNSNYTTVAFSCYGCHQNSVPGYATATNPTHTPTNFPTANSNCQGCHSTIAWIPSLWPMNHSTTAFAASYTGAHLALACTQCHNTGTWNTLGTGNNCYGCHSTDYAGATPPHTPTNYPQAGCACHNTTTWLNATAFDHSTVGFSMTGLHALSARQCADCHGIIGYTAKGTDQDCITCHATAYNSNGVLIHTSPNFPSTTLQCITCHAAANTSHTTWNNGVFAAHTTVTTNFSITNANHGGFQCSDCHTAATTDLKQFTCAASCHVSNGFKGHGNEKCGSATFNTSKATGVMKECYTACHKQGTKSPTC